MDKFDLTKLGSCYAVNFGKHETTLHGTISLGEEVILLHDL